MSAIFYAQVLVNGLMSSGTYILLALGLTLMFSILGVINFAHGEVYMLAGYAMLVFFGKLQFNFWVALFLTIALAAAVGAAMERVLFRPIRLNHMHGLVMSLGLAIVMQNAALLIWGPDDVKIPSAFSGVLRWHGVVLSVERMVVAGVSLGLALALYLFVHRTRWGLALRAVSQDADAAALQGMSINRAGALAFAVGSGVAAAAGGLIAPMFFVSPFVGEMPVMKAFAVIILGGMGNIHGVFLGGLLLGFAESVTSTFAAALTDMVGFAVIITVVLLKPSGLLGHE